MRGIRRPLSLFTLGLLFFVARAGVAASEAVFIGDTPETDGAAAAAAQVEFVLLKRPGALSETLEPMAC